MRTAAVLAGLLALAGCVSSSGETPAWFSEAQADAEGGYPSLRDVPRTTSANTDAAHWAGVETDLVTARSELQDNPRNEPAGPSDADAFAAEARQVLEETRQAHPD